MGLVGGLVNWSGNWTKFAGGSAPELVPTLLATENFDAFGGGLETYTLTAADDRLRLGQRARIDAWRGRDGRGRVRR